MTLLALLLLGCRAHAPPPFATVDAAERLAAQGVETWEPDRLAFSWIQTVWAYGVHRTHAASGEARWQDYNRSWMADHVADYEGEEPRAFDASDSMAPALLASTLMLEDGSEDWLPITDAADRYLEEVPRTADGAIVHWADESPFGPPDQVWIDSQFMFGVYLVREWERTGEDADLDLFVEQYLLFSDLCRDPTDQLYRHAWDDAAGANIPEEAVYWARGNSWVLVSAAEMLRATGLDHPAADEVLPLFRAHADAVAALQADDGLWHTVLNSPEGEDPSNYTETSGSALIAYAIAVGLRAGALEGETWLPLLARAMRGLEGRLEEQEDGWLEVEKTSHGTVPGDYAYYVSVETADDLMLGVGAMAMALAEVDGLPDAGAE